MSIITWLAFIIPMVIMLLLPFGLAFFFHRRFLVPWSIFFIAAGFCLISLLVQFSFIALQLVEYTPIAKLHLHWLVLALSALIGGVSEETMRYLSFRVGRVMRANRTANGALMAGVGHGGTELIVFALFIGFDLLARGLGLHTRSATILYAPWWSFSLGTILEIPAQIGFATLIVLAYCRSWLFYPLAIILHFLVNFSDSLTTLVIPTLIGNLLRVPVEGLLWALASLFFILLVRQTTLTNPETAEPVESM